MEFIIWSKDRAAQLYLLLESIEKVFDGFFYKTTILYTSSDRKYEEAYNECLKFNCDLIREENFYEDSINLIKSARLKICLLTDDTVFFSRIECEEYEDALDFLNISQNNIFSFRLGENTIMQDHINQIQQKKLLSNKYKKINYWSPINYPSFTNYGYPFAIDAHIYNKNFLLPKCESFIWNNTNDLEGGLQKFTKDVNLLGCFNNSRAVNIPYNNISGLTLVNNSNNISLSEANDKFLEGQKINLESIEKEKIVGCHQDVILEWVNR